MDISPIDSTVIPTIKLDALADLDANAAPVAPLIASPQPDNVASIVIFSPLSQLLAATVKFQTQQANQTQQVSAGATTSTGTSLDFKQLSEITTLFVDAFNNFQTSIASSVANPFDSVFNNALLTGIQTENTQSGSSSIQSFIDSLAEVGINFQAGTDFMSPSQFQIDWTTLASAYNANPAQTSALLSNAFQALGAIEENLLLSQQGLNLPGNEINPVLYDGVSASQIDTSAVAAELNSLINAEGPNVYDSAQLLLASEQLIEALDANLIASQTAAAKTSAAVTAATVATNTVEDNLNIATTASNAELASIEVTPPLVVVTNPANSPAANALVSNSDVSVANANSAVINSVNANASTSVSNTQATLEAVVIDPLIAVAVAAYRVGEAISAIPSDKPLNPAPESIQDIDQIPKVAPVTSNLHGGSNEGGHNQAAHNAAPDQSAGISSESASVPVKTKVDVSV
ncbi:hypothetical protein [Solimicrobium silvestre]|uniref:Uncharacterized protein n=1 Tax=Solimicrobium silvestre TaxID=2099400 RepID=A0A2S9GT76_9BURK|nr:hypothetical protein [Solimicrobium silvestre]PRC90920.1 hypothetical protein S2091_4413 [Solimicrobium silvestre]